MADKDIQQPAPPEPGPAPYRALEAEVHGSALEATRDLVETYIRPVIAGVEDPLTETHAMVAITKDGVVSIPQSVFDPYRKKPIRRRGKANLLTIESLIAHVNRFGDDDSAVFANNDRKAPSLTAVLDYHKAGATADPRFGDHRSLFSFPLADEWQAWNAMNNEPMTMKAFALFLQDHIIDVMPPQDVTLNDEASRFIDALGGTAKIANPAQLMEMARNFQIFEQSVVREAQTLSSGEMAVQFETTHSDSNGQSLQVPQFFVIAIPVFRGGERFQVIARLLYRKDGGQIFFLFQLWRLDLVFDTAFGDAVARVDEETEAQVFYGSPEA